MCIILSLKTLWHAVWCVITIQQNSIRLLNSVYGIWHLTLVTPGNGHLWIKPHPYPCHISTASSNPLQLSVADTSCSECQWCEERSLHKWCSGCCLQSFGQADSPYLHIHTLLAVFTEKSREFVCVLLCGCGFTQGRVKTENNKEHVCVNLLFISLSYVALWVFHCQWALCFSLSMRMAHFSVTIKWSGIISRFLVQKQMIRKDARYQP